MVEHNLAKVRVASSSLVFRSLKYCVSILRTFGSLLECPGGGMVDALVSGACVERRAGSSPVLGTRGLMCETLFKYGEVAELVDALL